MSRIRSLEFPARIMMAQCLPKFATFLNDRLENILTRSGTALVSKNTLARASCK